MSFGSKILKYGVYEIDEECAICYEPLGDVKPLGCGHRIHTVCLEKHFKAECPVCRTGQTRVVPKGKVPKSSPGRSVRYISSTAHEEKIVIFSKRECSARDKDIIEDVLTKKHRGEIISKQQMNMYVKSMKLIGDFTVTVVSL